MRILSLCAAALVLMAGCTGGDTATDTASVSATPSSASTGDRARDAAAVANAIKANPAAADSILKAAGYTRDSFQELMYDIAADSAMSATYAAAHEP